MYVNLKPGIIIKLSPRHAEKKLIYFKDWNMLEKK